MTKTWLPLMTVLLLSGHCNKGGSPGIPIEEYARFQSQCRLVEQMHPEDTPRRRAMLGRLMKEHNMDSVSLEKFFAYYENKPEEWLDVERAVLKELENHEKGRSSNGK